MVQFQSFEQLVSKASSYLLSLSYSKLSVSRFESVWKDVYSYMRQRGIKYYKAETGTLYLLNRSGNIDYSLLSAKEKRYIRAVSVLSDFQHSGTIRRKKSATVGALLKGKIGNSISEFIDYLKAESQLSQQTIKNSARQLAVFLKYLNTNKNYRAT